MGRADEAAAVASVCVMYYDGEARNDASHNDDENVAPVALAAAVATEKLL